MTDKVFYLSGPMSGIKDHNFPAFKTACEDLRRERCRGGLELKIISPHEVPFDQQVEVGALPWTVYLHRDLQEMLDNKCDAIILLPGWSKSNGAKLELQLALGLKMDVYFYDNVAGLLICMERAA
jgi:hypothetical protein